MTLVLKTRASRQNLPVYVYIVFGMFASSSSSSLVGSSSSGWSSLGENECDSARVTRVFEMRKNTLKCGKQFWRKVYFWNPTWNLTCLSGQNTCICTTLNHMYYSLSTTALRHSVTITSESFTLSFFVSPHFLCTAFPLCDCLYHEKDVGGGLCHSHISHLVHQKILIWDRL